MPHSAAIAAPPPAKGEIGGADKGDRTIGGFTRLFAVRQILTGLVNSIMLSILALVPATVGAEVFKYQDRAGNLHFTDNPMRGADYRLLWRSGNDPLFDSYARIDVASMQRNRVLYSALIEREAERWQLSPQLLHAVIRAESAYDPNALSRAGAQGLMQLMPETARRFDVDNVWDPSENLQGGARYLRELMDMFDADLELVLAAYNAGENAVRKYGNQVPPYPETKNYVQKVIAFYQGG